MNAALLEQAVINLLDNAIKYSEPGSEVQVLASQFYDEVTITVSDRGCGIAAEHLPRIFERFYRVDKGAQPQTGGHRLGTGYRQAYRAGAPRPRDGQKHRRRRQRVYDPSAPPQRA